MPLRNKEQELSANFSFATVSPPRPTNLKVAKISAAVSSCVSEFSKLVGKSTPATSKKKASSRKRPTRPSPVVAAPDPTAGASFEWKHQCRISRIIIENFKKIQKVDIDFSGDGLVLIGGNNSGKSSVIQAVHFAVSVAQTARFISGETIGWRRAKKNRSKARVNGAEVDQLGVQAKVFENTINPQDFFYMPIADPMCMQHGGVLSEEIGSAVAITLFDDEGHSCKVTVRRGRNKNLAILLEGENLGEKMMSFAHPLTIYAPGLAGIPKEEAPMGKGVVRRVVARGDANLALRNVLRLLHEKKKTHPSTINFSNEKFEISKKWLKFEKAMQDLFPDISFELVYDEDVDQYINVYILNGKTRIPLDAGGTSILQAAQILAYVYLFEPSILILDEPDSHLHPGKQRELTRVLMTIIREEGVKIMMSTHSRHVFDEMRGTGSKMVWMQDGNILEENQDVASLLMGIGALDSFDSFATKKCIVFTEDKNKEYLKEVLSSNHFKMNEVEIISYEGSGQLDFAVNIAKCFSRNIPGVFVIVHRDRDFIPDAKRALMEKDARTGERVKIFFTQGSDIESYFCSSGHIAQALSISMNLSEAVLNQAKKRLGGKDVASATRDFAADLAKSLDGNADSAAFFSELSQKSDTGFFFKGKNLLRAILDELHSNPSTKLLDLSKVKQGSPAMIDENLVSISRLIWKSHGK